MAPPQGGCEPPASQQEQLQQALEALQALTGRVKVLEARLAGTTTSDTGRSSQSSMPYLQRHSSFVLPTAADRLRGDGDRAAAASAAARPLLSPRSADAALTTAGAGASVARAMESEVPMSATRIVMAQIVSPGDSNGLDVCMVSPGRIPQARSFTSCCCHEGGTPGWPCMRSAPRAAAATRVPPCLCIAAGRHRAELDRHLCGAGSQNVCTRALRHRLGRRGALPAALPRGVCGGDCRHGQPHLSVIYGGACMGGTRMCLSCSGGACVVAAGARN